MFANVKCFSSSATASLNRSTSVTLSLQPLLAVEAAGADHAVTRSKEKQDKSEQTKENCGVFLHEFTPAVLVCVVNNEGDPVAGHLQQ